MVKEVEKREKVGNGKVTRGDKASGKENVGKKLNSEEKRKVGKGKKNE